MNVDPQTMADSLRDNKIRYRKKKEEEGNNKKKKRKSAFKEKMQKFKLEMTQELQKKKNVV